VEHRQAGWIIAATLLGVILSIAVFTPGASAHPRRHHRFPKPSLSWSLPRIAHEGAAIPFSWTGKRLGRSHRLVVQKPEGTAHTWRTIMRLNSNSGSAELAALALGKYRFRIADLSGRRVLAQQVSGIGVFGEVPFSTLFGSRGSIQIATFPHFTFPYVIYWGGEFDDNPIFQVEHNECLSVHIAFVPSKTTNGEIELVQESHDAIGASVADNAIGSLDAQVVPGQSWAVNGQGLEDIHINGYAICDSTRSFF
jgi:hypothetical protein